MNSLLRFNATSEAAFNAIFRRSLIIKINARFLDAKYLRDHLPEHERYGIFARQPDLKAFMVSGVAVAAGLKLQAGYEKVNNEATCRQ